MLGGEYNWIITSELANQRGPKALFSYVVYTKDVHIYRNASLQRILAGNVFELKNSNIYPKKTTSKPFIAEWS